VTKGPLLYIDDVAVTILQKKLQQEVLRETAQIASWLLLSPLEMLAVNCKRNAIAAAANTILTTLLGHDPETPPLH
jgi:hypothetical protein